MSAVDTAVIHPRRKLGQAKLGRGTRAVSLTKRDLENLMHLRLSVASKQLGISATTVKKVCRTLGINTWGNASFRGHCAVTPVPSPRSSSSDASAHDNKHTRHTSHFSGVPAPLPVADAMYIYTAAPAKLEHASSRAASHGAPGFLPAPTLTQSALDVSFFDKCTTDTRAQMRARSSLDVASDFAPDATSWSGVHLTICAATPEMPPSLVEPFSDIESDDDFASIARCDPHPYTLNPKP